MDGHAPSCPFCPFVDSDATFVAQHIEFCHPEGGTPPILSDESHFANPTLSPQSANEDAIDKYVDCPYDCGETVTAIELSTHLDLHVAEDIALDEDGTPSHENSPAANDNDLPSDYEEPPHLPGSRKSGKTGPDRPPAQAKTGKPGRTRSPPGTIGPDGAKRLGVFHPSWPFISTVCTDLACSARSWVHMPTRKRCPRGFERC